jgi:hypothetical protein
MSDVRMHPTLEALQSCGRALNPNLATHSALLGQLLLDSGVESIFLKRLTESEDSDSVVFRVLDHWRARYAAGSVEALVDIP